ncbi:MAG: preprotein translocase subunit SecE [Clostridia bacterium]|nr:preprotein translocase subunit SecE [Clostridia bacterium]
MTEHDNDLQTTESKSVAPSKKEKPASSKKPGFFARIGRRVAKVWRDYISEMKKVVWMSGKDVKKSTLLVCVMVVSMGVAIGFVDFVFSEVIGGIAGLIG